MAKMICPPSNTTLAEALREAALQRGLTLSEPIGFESLPGFGVRAEVDGRQVWVGNQRLVDQSSEANLRLDAIRAEFLEEGKSLLFIALEGKPVGLFSAQDKPRPEIAESLQEVERLGIRSIEILTGDTAQSAQALLDSLGGELNIRIRANLLPEDKNRIVVEYQRQGHVVAMVGDGVNDAAALAQADVGIAMPIRGAAGSDLAIEAAHISLMRDDWRLVPAIIQIARRTMGVVKMNLGFTAVYNIVGLSLAAFGLLPPVLAAAAQSLPDLGILANSSRLIRQKA
jgi:Cu+-exporting ATPase